MQGLIRRSHRVSRTQADPSFALKFQSEDAQRVLSSLATGTSGAALQVTPRPRSHTSTALYAALPQPHFCDFYSPCSRVAMPPTGFAGSCGRPPSSSPFEVDPP